MTRESDMKVREELETYRARREAEGGVSID